MIRSKFNEKFQHEVSFGQVISVEKYYRPLKQKINLATNTQALAEIETELDSKMLELKTEYDFCDELTGLLSSFRQELTILLNSKRKALTND